MPTDVLDAHTFIHRINTIVVKITPILKTFITFISYIILTIFAKRSAKVLNIPRFWICQCYTGFWICLNMPDCTWLNMLGYVWICHNGFCFIFPHCNPCLLKRVVNYFWVSFFFQRLHKIRSFSVKENEAVFWRHKIWFFYSSCKNFCCFENFFSSWFLF